MTDELVIRHMTRPEVDVLVGWAAREGWNPGLPDAELFRTNDPEAFIAAELGGCARAPASVSTASSRCRTTTPRADSSSPIATSDFGPRSRTNR
jgi:hypothetical protein